MEAGSVTVFGFYLRDKYLRGCSFDNKIELKVKKLSVKKSTIKLTRLKGQHCSKLLGIIKFYTVDEQL